MPKNIKTRKNKEKYKNYSRKVFKPSDITLKYAEFNISNAIILKFVAYRSIVQNNAAKMHL